MSEDEPEADGNANPEGVTGHDQELQTARLRSRQEYDRLNSPAMQQLAPLGAMVASSVLAAANGDRERAWDLFEQRIVAAVRLKLEPDEAD